MGSGSMTQDRYLVTTAVALKHAVEKFEVAIKEGNKEMISETCQEIKNLVNVVTVNQPLPQEKL